MIEMKVNGHDAWVTFHSATYGFRDGMADVRERVVKGIQDGVLDLLVNNETMGGDPCPGAQKELILTYAIGEGPVQTLRRKEHERLRVP
jgi:hypothetical protein